jgi:hypothetical protein
MRAEQLNALRVPAHTSRPMCLRRPLMGPLHPKQQARVSWPCTSGCKAPPFQVRLPVRPAKRIALTFLLRVTPFKPFFVSGSVSAAACRRGHTSLTVSLPAVVNRRTFDSAARVEVGLHEITRQKPRPHPNLTFTTGRPEQFNSPTTTTRLAATTQASPVQPSTLQPTYHTYQQRYQE